MQNNLPRQVFAAVTQVCAGRIPHSMWSLVVVDEIHHAKRAHTECVS